MYAAGAVFDASKQEVDSTALGCDRFSLGPQILVPLEHLPTQSNSILQPTYIPNF